jgi:hypothetical protein
MAEIVFGVLTTHLAFVTTNGAFHNNFGSGSRRSVHVGWGHTLKLRASRACRNTNRLPQGYLHAFRWCKASGGTLFTRSYDSLGFAPGVCYTKTSR